MKSAYRRTELKATRPNETWSMDFMSDALFNGKRFRMLTIIDNYTRESLITLVGQNLRGGDVVGALNVIAQRRPLSEKVLCDNNQEFT
jgi:putative transposase